MAMGVSYKDFWSLNNRTLKVIMEGYRLRRKVADEQDWLRGRYMFDAINIALSNAFRSKNEAASDYFDLIKKPYLAEGEIKQEMDEEEKQRQRDLLMAQLETMQRNFEMSHGKG